jgi:hypothetical protein
MARELFRYRKADRTRTYRLRTLDDGSAELWVDTAGGRQEPKSRKLMALAHEEDAGPLLESVEQELRAGGWAEG